MWAVAPSACQRRATASAWARMRSMPSSSVQSSDTFDTEFASMRQGPRVPSMTSKLPSSMDSTAAARSAASVTVRGTSG